MTYPHALIDRVRLRASRLPDGVQVAFIFSLLIWLALLAS